MTTKAKDPRELFRAALEDLAVVDAARAIQSARDEKSEPTLSEVLELGRAIAAAAGSTEIEKRLRAELHGYQDVDIDVPPERRATGFASAFPVRALDLGMLDPEEIFLANREKFSQVSLTIGQPIEELQGALAQLRQGGVLALKVPASEVTADSALTDEDTEVYIYILPREIQRIVDWAKGRALDAVINALVGGIVGR
jgi:hypothetical protein